MPAPASEAVDRAGKQRVRDRGSGVLPADKTRPKQALATEKVRGELHLAIPGPISSQTGAHEPDAFVDIALSELCRTLQAEALDERLRDLELRHAQLVEGLMRSISPEQRRRVEWSTTVLTDGHAGRDLAKRVMSL
jgi:hypothetical protein